MKILYEKLVLEDINAVKKVFTNRFPDMSDEEFNEIIKLDPTYNENRDSVGTYGKWLLGLYKKDNPLEYDVELIYNLLNLYNSYKNDRKKDIEKDINKFKSIADLYDAVNNAGDAELSARQHERELRNSKDIKKIFEDSKWEVWVPLSYAGSCTLGKGTEWCTAYSGNDSYYKEYIEYGPLYVFINKQNPKEKYQLHVETYSFMDKDDDEADLEDVLATDDKLREFVYNEIYGYKIDDNGNFIYTDKNQVPDSATSVVVEQGVTSIEPHVFTAYKSLKSINIPNSVTSIGRGAFENCESLQSIVIPDSVTTIDDSAFENCESLQSIVIPNSVTMIGDSAFRYCESLQSVVIPDSVININDNTFSRCESLKLITIPNAVKHIGYYAFSYCISLKSINIPDSVMSIGNGAFDSCVSLKSINIPDSVTSIDSYAFIRCTSLQSIKMSNSVTSIGRGTFAYCTSLRSIDIPDSVTNIGVRAFYNCESIQSVKIPDSVSSIGDYAFNGCYNLKEVILENPDTECGENTFPKHTKIIKKGVNENMKIKTNESINLRKAKKLLENNGYVVRKKKYLKESDDNTWSNILQSISKTIDSIDNVTMNAQSNINDILHGKHAVIPNIVLSDSETSFLLDIYDKLILLQDEISQIDDYIWRR